VLRDVSEVGSQGCEAPRFIYLLDNQLRDVGEVGPQSCETSSFTYLLDSRLRDGGEVSPPCCETSSFTYLLDSRLRDVGEVRPPCCETSRFTYLLDNRLRDGGEVVGLTHRPLFTSETYTVLISVRESVETRSRMMLKGLESLQKFNIFNGNRAPYFSDYNIMP
jgi:hypothetical protein